MRLSARLRYAYHTAIFGVAALIKCAAGKVSVVAGACSHRHYSKAAQAEADTIKR